MRPDFNLLCRQLPHVFLKDVTRSLYPRTKLKEAANRGGLNLILFSLFVLQLPLPHHMCGNLLPVITVFDVTAARNRVGRSERHPITLGGLVVIPTGLRHKLVLHLSYRRSA
jgi:hypothetical protein